MLYRCDPLIDCGKGPNELTVFDPDILAIVLKGAKNSFSKSAWYDNLKPYTGLNTYRDKAEHDQRRRIWDHGFTTTGFIAKIVQYIPILT